MQQIIFDSAPEFVVLCIVVALLYAGVQYYRTKHPWSVKMNWLLFALRATLAFFIAFLILGPIVKQINNLFEKPAFIILQDNSASIKEAVDSTSLRSLQQAIGQTQEMLINRGYDARTNTLTGGETNEVSFNANTSDIHGALKRIANRYEGKNVAGVILISDGIYNAGLSPLYASYNFPVYTVGIGDTAARADIALKNIAYNKIAYQGNKFPLRAEVQLRNINSNSITATLLKRGKVIDKQTRNVSANQLLTFDFQPVADEQGIQKYDIQVETKPEEYNTRNNRSSVFVEVVEGKKKILCVAASPHPDIKAIREVVEKNSNYDFILYIPGVAEQQASALQPNDIDLAIFHQSPDLRGKTNNIFQSFAKSKTSLLLIMGMQSDLQQLVRQNMPIKFDGIPRDYDDVTPVINGGFSNFIISPGASTTFANFPPVSVPFGKIQLPLSATPLLYQRIGSVATEKPLLAIDIQDSRKIALMLGEGLWRWRLNEYDRTESTASFDEVIGKLVQFMSTTDDKRRFRSYPLQQEFSDTEPVVFESQVYNDIFEPVYGNTIAIELTDESGKRNEYTYVTSPGNTRYQIGGLKEGVYRFRSSTDIEGKTETVRGEFAIVERQSELMNLTADFDLLRKLSSNTGGNFHKANEIEKLQAVLQRAEAKSIIHSEETYDAMINIKWVFWLLLILVSAEWALRKYHGSY